MRPVGPGTIVDGTSNTIVLPEDSQVDVCAGNVRRLVTIADGSSNTIQLGETIPQSCHTSVHVDGPESVAVPEPPSGLLFLLGTAALGLAAARRR